MGGPDQSLGQGTEALRSTNARKFREIVRGATAREGLRYHDHEKDNIVQSAASLSITHGPFLEFLHFNPARVGTTVGRADIHQEGLALNLRERGQDAQIVPTDAIVISDTTSRIRVTFALYEDGYIDRTYVHGISLQNMQPSSALVLSRTPDPDELEAVVRYATSPHLYPESFDIATRLNREEQERVGEKMAEETIVEVERLEAKRTRLAEHGERILKGEE